MTPVQAAVWPQMSDDRSGVGFCASVARSARSGRILTEDVHRPELALFGGVER